jgi:hypothetical protein
MTSRGAWHSGMPIGRPSRRPPSGSLPDRPFRKAQLLRGLVTAAAILPVSSLLLHTSPMPVATRMVGYVLWMLCLLPGMGVSEAACIHSVANSVHADRGSFVRPVLCPAVGPRCLQPTLAPGQRPRAGLFRSCRTGPRRLVVPAHWIRATRGCVPFFGDVGANGKISACSVGGGSRSCTAASPSILPA